MNHFVATCLAQAQLARATCPPNPAVGAVLVNPSGHVIGLGHTQRAGQAHAEVMALRDAAARGESVTGATLYVTLEPCAHHGRTGPCSDALIAAGIARVVASVGDPNPLVSGQGFARLRAAGIEVQVGDGATQSRELNIGFFTRMTRQSPWVRMKIAASLDGNTALENGQSQWITGPEARQDGHLWRARACGVLTGIGTILQDNPRLDVRLVPTLRQPHLIIVDSRLETPPDALLFEPERQVWIYAAASNPTRAKALTDRGATITYMPGQLPATSEKVDLPAMLRDLAHREVNELHIEAGHRLNGSFIKEGLVDEFLVYLAPKLLGAGQPMASFGPLDDLAQGTQLDFVSAVTVASDLRVLARIRRVDSPAQNSDTDAAS